MRTLNPQSVASIGIGNVMEASIELDSVLRNRRSVVTIANPPATATSIAIETSGSESAAPTDHSRSRASGSAAAAYIVFSHDRRRPPALTSVPAAASGLWRGHDQRPLDRP